MSRFDNDGFCRECGQHRESHEAFVNTDAEMSRDYTLVVYRCVDPSLPDPKKDDDPWAPVAHEPEPAIAELFDPVCV